ncbi:MAG TPA: 6-carboxytetrahydropterin synthase [Candidatus Kapabacteria bacterium]|jgi:6-pyruvoyltetrahydropterin/6-carboxytetrahydropterin synthase|nr:6-carboxytetrahydropterin synthase [Ignavibacteria bacterium]HRK58876.1 6-carboxytetrahydropterin synthase [Candidatus Kapabacteria bacterium]
MVYVTRKSHFSASHRLYNPTFSDEKNDAIFDKCNNLHGHGHNYVLEVTVKGLPDPSTGYVIDLKQLRDIIELEIIDKVDHKHLNYDVPFLEGIIPTAENIAVIFWSILEKSIPMGTLHSVKLYESDNNFVEYFGEPVNIPNFKAEEVLS